MTRTKSRKTEWGVRGDGEVVVALDDRFVRMYQSVQAYRNDGRLSVDLALVPPGRYVVMGVTFTGSADEPVAPAELRVALADVVAYLTQLMTEDLAEQPDGTWTPTRIDMAQARQINRRAPKRTLTPEFLREQVAPVVAECEREGIPVGRGLAERFTISDSTARNWLMRLRELEGQR